MVRVPLPQEPLRPAGSATLSAPSTVAPVDVVGAQFEQLGQAMRSAGAATFKLAAAAEERLHVAVVKEAQARAGERILEADRGFTSLIGKDATGDARKLAWTQLQEQLRPIEEGLQDDVQRRLFREVVGRQLIDVNDRWSRHEIEQLRVREIGASKTVLETKIETYRQAAQEPAQRARGAQAPQVAPGGPGAQPSAPGALATPEVIRVWQTGQVAETRARARSPDPMQPVRAEAEALADKLGLGPEETAALVRDATTRAHAGAVEDLIQADRVGEARDHLAAAGDEIDPDTRTRLQAVVQRKSTADDGAQLALRIQNELTAQHRQRLRDPARTETLPLNLPAETMMNRGLQRVQAMYAAGEITIDVRDAASGEVERLAKMQRAAEVERTNDVAQQGEQWLIDNPYASVTSMPAVLYQTGRQLELLDDWNAFANSGRRYSTDEALFARLFPPGGDGLFSLPPREFWADMRRKLDPQHFKTAMALYADANQIADPKLTDAISLNMQVKEAARKLGIQENPEAFINFFDDVVARINSFELTQGGKTATYEQRKLLVNEAIQDKAYLDQALFDKPVAIGQRTEEERESRAYITSDQLTSLWFESHDVTEPVPTRITNTPFFYLDRIADPVRQKIITELRRRGLPVSQARIVMTWLEEVEGIGR